MTNKSNYQNNTAVAALLFFCIFCVYFSMQIVYSLQPTFVDEYENILGGKYVIHGLLPYRDFYSQHTPFAYFLSAFGHLVGLSSVPTQRLFFYAVISLALAGLYLRNKKDFGNVPMFFVGFLYLTSHSANPVMAYTFLSDQIAAICFLFLVFEFLRISVLKQVKISSWIVISISGFLAIASTFIAVYFVAFIYFFSLLFFLITQFNQSKTTKSRRKIIDKQFWQILGIFSAPFLIAIIYLWSQNALTPMYEQAYVLNRQIYPKYLGSYGQDLISPLINVAASYIPHVAGLVNALFGPDIFDAARNLVNVLWLLLLIFSIAKKSKLAAISLIIIIAILPIRGWNGFHSQGFWAISSLAAGLLIWGTSSSQIRIWPKTFKLPFSLLATIPLTTLMSIGWIIQIFAPLPPGSLSWNQINSEKIQIIEAVVPANQTYFDTSIDLGTFVESDRLATGGINGLVPWFTDQYESEFISKLQSKKPLIVFHDPNNSVWNYKIKDYAPNLDAYIFENYQKIEINDGGEVSDLFLLKSQFSTTLAVLKNKLPLLFKYQNDYTITSESMKPIGEILPSQAIDQTFISNSNLLSYIKIMTATYARSNDCHLKITLIGPNQELILQKIMLCNSVPDNGFIDIEFSPIADSYNKQFTLTISSEDSKPGDAVTLWWAPGIESPGNSLTFGKNKLQGSIFLSVNSLRGNK